MRLMFFLEDWKLNVDSKNANKKAGKDLWFFR